MPSINAGSGGFNSSSGGSGSASAQNPQPALQLSTSLPTPIPAEGCDGSIGTGATAARADHQHATPRGLVTVEGNGRIDPAILGSNSGDADTYLNGSGDFVAIPGASPSNATPITVTQSGSASAGSASAFARGDHTHAMGPITTLRSSGADLLIGAVSPNQLLGRDGGTGIVGVPIGSTAGSVAAGNDSRFLNTDERSKLSNVPSDTNTALSGKQSTSEKDQINGYAALGADRKVAVARLPVGTIANTIAAGDDSRFITPDERSKLGNVPANTNSQLSSLTADLSGKQSIVAKNQAGGYAGLDGSGLIDRSQMGSGTADSTTYLRGDGTWAVPAGGGGGGGDTTFFDGVRWVDYFNRHGNIFTNGIGDGWALVASGGDASSGRNLGSPPASDNIAWGECKMQLNAGSAGNFVSLQQANIRKNRRIRMIARIRTPTPPSVSNDYIAWLGLHMFGALGYYGPGIFGLYCWQGNGPNWQLWLPDGTNRDTTVPISDTYMWFDYELEHTTKRFSLRVGSRLDGMTTVFNQVPISYTTHENSELIIAMHWFSGSGAANREVWIDTFALESE